MKNFELCPLSALFLILEQNFPTRKITSSLRFPRMSCVGYVRQIRAELIENRITEQRPPKMICYLIGIFVYSFVIILRIVPTRQQHRAGKMALEEGQVNFSDVPVELRQSVLNLYQYTHYIFSWQMEYTIYPTYDPRVSKTNSTTLLDIIKQFNYFNQPRLIIISMNKQNQFVGGFNLWTKSNFKRLIEPDNSVLHAKMPETTRGEILKSHQFLESQFEEFLGKMVEYESCGKINQEYALVSTVQELQEVKQFLKKQRLVFIKIFEETHRSFKGFCTWISITTLKQTYLIDVMSLRKEIEDGGFDLFTDPNILKVGLNLKQQIQGLQRDFSIFTRTVFDLNEILSLYILSSDLQPLIQQYFPKIPLPQKGTANFYRRPSNDNQLKYISASSQVLTLLLSTVRKRLDENKTILEAFLISNKLCLEVFECKLSKFSQQFEELMKQLNTREQRICKKLLKWRVHTARIRDESPQFILPSTLIRLIIKHNVKSMGDLLNLYEKDYDQTFLDIINSQSSKIDITKAQQQVDQCKSLSDFVKMMGWADCNWKNSNCESIRLFKEIISMDPIESSIIENELNETKNRALTNDEVMDLFGYVEYFTKNDVKGLQAQYAKFMKNYKAKTESEEASDTTSQQKVFKIPETIQQIYELANTKKKAIKKDKKKGGVAEEKQEMFVIDTQQFLRSIGWN